MKSSATIRPPRATRPHATDAAVEWPFVGRDRELRELRRATLGNEARGAVVAGPPGVGKTRLALECLRCASTAGRATLAVTAARSARGSPFDGLGSSTVAGGALLAVDETVDLMGHAARALTRSATGAGPLVLLVDDAHLLDRYSADLVHHLALSGTAFVLATVAAGRPAPDAVIALWRDGLAERIELTPLPEGSIGRLLPLVLGGPVEPTTVQRLAARCEGSVLFLTGLVDGARAQGLLADAGEAWQLLGAPPVSEHLTRAVERRLAELDPATRALAELVAFAHPLGDAELAALADPAQAESLERHGVLSSRLNGRRLEIGLPQPVVAHVLRARLPAARRRAIARSLVQVAEATGARRYEDRLRLASWHLVDPTPQPQVLLAGAADARRHHRYALGERLARAATDAGAGFDARFQAARLAGLRGRTTVAERELAALATRADDDAQRGRVALARIDNSVTWTGHDEGGILDGAQAAIADPAWRDELAARQAALLLRTRGPRVAVEAALPLLERAQGRALGFTRVVAAHGLGRLGRFDASLDLARQVSAGRARSSGLRGLACWATFVECLTLSWAGWLAEAEALATSHHRDAVAGRAVEAQGAFAMARAMSVAERGDVVTAARCAEEALALGRRANQPLMIRPCLVFGALALALGGRAREAAAKLAALDDLEVPAGLHDEVDVLHARAWTAVAGGRMAAAHRHLERAATCARGMDDAVGEATVLHGLARLGGAEAARHRLAAVAAPIEGGLAAARVTHTDALATDDASRLEQVARDFEAMGADLLAAEAAAAAAAIRRRMDDTQAAVTAERHARDLTERCEAPVTPALRRLRTAARLTAAERAAASLAATGRSNQQIAQALGLSVRTVENRLQRVYRKLRVSGRAALADALAIR